MLKTILRTSAVSLFLLPTLALADTISAGLGIHGISIEYTRPFSDSLNTRLILSDFPFEADSEEDDVEYEIEYNRTNLGLLMDYRPLKGSFHLTGGLFMGEHEWLLNAKAGDGTYELGDNDTAYSSSNLGLDAEVEFSRAAPYLGLGWGNAANGGPFTVNFDMGILYIGSPSVDFEASGTICPVTSDSSCLIPIKAENSPQLQQDIEEERQTLEDDLEDFKALLILQLSFGYRF